MRDVTGNLLETKHPFQDANVINALAEGIKNTLGEMAQLQCEFGRPFVEKDWNAVADGTGVMELKSIKHKGFMLIHFPKDAIFKIIGNMVGEPPKEFNNDVLDGIGEITNIVYGSMKAKLNPLGYEFRMATPKSQFTKDLEKIKLQKQLMIPFQIENYKCYIEIAMI